MEYLGRQFFIDGETIFSSDNVTIACPEIMDALVKANSGNVDSYGDDKWSESLKKKMSDLFEKDVHDFQYTTYGLDFPEVFQVGKDFC